MLRDYLEKIKQDKKKAERKDTTLKVGAGVTVGLAIGAVAGVLFAPKKGEEIRKEIVEKTKSVIDDSKKMFNSKLELLEQKKEEVEVIVDDLKEAVDDKVEERKKNK